MKKSTEPENESETESEKFSLPANYIEKGYGEVVVQRLENHAFIQKKDFVASEVPIALVFNGISHAVMLASPLDLVDFALGFSFSEGIIQQRSEVYEIEEIVHPGTGIEIHLTIASSCFARLKERRRSLVGRTGCGLCGLESLTAFESGLAPDNADQNYQTENKFVISQKSLFKAFKSLQDAQSINRITGSMHAAAWVNAEGELLLVREDLGRHNALDKLIGALIGANTPRENGCVLMTSRASYELAQKSVRAHVPLLATISAPTSLAIQLAEQNQLTLVGFVRNASLVAYSCSDRIQLI